MKRRFVFALLALPLVGCGPMSGKRDTMQQPTEPTVQEFIGGRFTPPPGKTLMIIGQDVQCITDYAEAVAYVPGGVTGYTSVQRTEGVIRMAAVKSGGMHLSYLARQFPHSVIAVGVYAVDYLDVINEGRADAKLEFLIRQFASYDRPVFLRFGYEFDGLWNHYDPEAFVTAWQRVHRLIREHGADNIVMVWQGATYCDGTYRSQPISAWYPGDDYVDWMGLSFFTQADCNYRPIEEFLTFAREHHKPVLIAEASPQRYDLRDLTFSTDGAHRENITPERIWEEWYQPLFDLVYRHQDIIRGLAYINTRWDDDPMWGPPYENGYWGDSRVQVNEEILERWNRELARDQWLHGGPTLFETLAYTNASAGPTRTP